MSLEMKPPFWVVGTPRSGTTFLARVLNNHRDIFLTNETRVMLLFNRMLTQLPKQRSLLATSRDEILTTLWNEVPAVVEAVYRDLGARPDQRWGDKNPHYADSKNDPEALSTIDRLFPESQFVHLIRDPRAVVGSIKQKGWLSLEDSVATWRNHVSHARDFGLSIGPSRYYEIRYEALVPDGVEEVGRVLDFLGLPPDDAVRELLEQEEVERTPVSWPIGETGLLGAEAWAERLNDEELRYVESELEDMMLEFGYERVSV